MLLHLIDIFHYYEWIQNKLTVWAVDVRISNSVYIIELEKVNPKTQKNR